MAEQADREVRKGATQRGGNLFKGATVFVFAITVFAADNFTAKQVQGVFGQFVPVLDNAVGGDGISQNNVQGVFGQFVPVLDEVAGTAAPAPEVAPVVESFWDDI